MAAVRRLTVVVATGLVLVTPVHAADRPAPLPSDGFAGSLSAAVGTPATRDVTRIDGSAAAPQTSKSAATASGGLGFTYPVPDGTGDDVPDVLAFNILGERARMTCRSGTDGRITASLAVPAESYAERVGATWSTVLVYDKGPDARTDDRAQLTVRWVEGCRQRWARTFVAGDEDPTGADAGGSMFVEVTGVIGASTRRAAVVVETSTQAAATTPLVARSVVHVVSGEDGVTLFKSEPTTFVDELPRLVLLPDVSGDGRGDYAYAIDDTMGPTLPTRGDRVDAYASDDGRRLWTLATATVDPDVEPVGDADGDGAIDFVLSPSFGPGDGETTGAALVSGETGTVRWQHRAWSPRVVRSRPLRIGLSALTREADSYWLEVAAVDAAGSQRYASRRRVAPSATGSTTFHHHESLGDVDADGVIDVVHRIRVAYQNGPDEQLNLVVSGRRGTTRSGDVRGLVPFGWPAGSAVLDGRGDDVWSPGSLTIRSGDDGTQLARWLPRTAVAQMYVTRADRDACLDLFVVTGKDPLSGTGDENTPRQLFVVSGATGNVLWSFPASKPGSRVLDGRLGTCGAPRPAPPPAVTRPPAGIPATGAAPAWPAVVVAATGVAAGRLRRRTTAGAVNAGAPRRLTRTP